MKILSRFLIIVTVLGLGAGLAGCTYARGIKLKNDAECEQQAEYIRQTIAYIRPYCDLLIPFPEIVTDVLNQQSVSAQNPITTGFKAWSEKKELNGYNYSGPFRSILGSGTISIMIKEQDGQRYHEFSISKLTNKMFPGTTLGFRGKIFYSNYKLGASGLSHVQFIIPLRDISNLTSIVPDIAKDMVSVQLDFESKNAPLRPVTLTNIEFIKKYGFNKIVTGTCALSVLVNAKILDRDLLNMTLSSVKFADYISYIPDTKDSKQNLMINGDFRNFYRLNSNNVTNNIPELIDTLDYLPWRDIEPKIVNLYLETKK